MRVLDIHDRVLDASIDLVGELIDRLSSAEDALWPRDRWPPMRFDRPLGPGAAGGHGPIRYVVVSHDPGREVRFRFTGPKGFHGGHVFQVEKLADGRTRLRHTIDMNARGAATFAWPLLFHPLHDALIEDAFDRAEAFAAGRPTAHRSWSGRVRLLRWLTRRFGRRRA